MPRSACTAVAVLLGASVLPQIAAAACIAGTKCVTAPVTSEAAGFKVGDHLPRGQYQILLNSEYYGLPPVIDGTWYFRVDHRVMRVRPDTLEILEDVTHLANRAF